MFCSNCGNQVADGSLFCNNCGTSLKTAAPEPKVPDVVISPMPNITPAPIPPVHITGTAEAEADADVNSEIPSAYGSNFSEPEQISKTDFASSVLPKPAPGTMPTVSMTYETPSAPEPTSDIPAQNEPAPEIMNQKVKVKEKVFFGKGALAFCIFLITILSVTAGVFAALYLKEIGFSINLW